MGDVENAKNLGRRPHLPLPVAHFGKAQRVRISECLLSFLPQIAGRAYLFSRTVNSITLCFTFLVFSRNLHFAAHGARGRGLCSCFRARQGSGRSCIVTNDKLIRLEFRKRRPGRTLFAEPSLRKDESQ